LSGPALRRLGATAPLLALVGLAVGVPAAMLFAYSFRNASFLGLEPGYTLAQYGDILDSATDRKLLLKSLGVGLVVAGLVTVTAFVAAFGLSFRLKGRRRTAALAIVVASAVASYLVRVYAWGTILGTRGVLNSALESLGLIDAPLEFLFFGYFSIVVTMVYVYLPLGVLLVFSAMQGIDTRSLEASRDLGGGRWRTALFVAAPGARAGLVATVLFVAILASSDYITPSLVGGTRGQMVGSVIRDSAIATGNVPAAAAMAFVFVLGLLGALALLALAWRAARWLARGVAPHVDRVSAAAVRATPGWLARRSLSLPATVLVLVYLVTPTVVVAIFSLNSGRTVSLPFRGLTLDWYSRAVSADGFTSSLRTSAAVAVVGVGAALVVGLLAALAARDRSRGWARAVAAAVYAPYVVPGVLIGTAVIALASENIVDTGVAVTALMHAAIAVPIIVLVVGARLGGLDARLVDAARDLGSAPRRAFRTVTLPLLLPSLLGAACLATAVSLDELIVTNFTIGTDSTLPVWLLGQAGRGFTPAVNAIGVMLLGGTLVLFLVAALSLRRA
jgi:putative spermidine/putrescine transport system permease protein